MPYYVDHDQCYSCELENRDNQNEDDLQNSFECNQCKKWYCSICMEGMEDNKKYTQNQVCDNCDLKTIEIDGRFEKEILEYMYTLIHKADGQRGLSKMGVFLNF